MKTKLILAGVLASMTTMSATAETFSTSTDVTRVLTPLSIVQKTAMVLPVVRVDEGSPDNTVLCASYYNPDPDKNYCTGAFNNGVYTISGSPHATVDVTIETTSAIVNGLSFQAYHLSIPTLTTGYTLDAGGNNDMELRAHLTLEDKTAVTTSNYVWNFDVTSVYN